MRSRGLRRPVSSTQNYTLSLRRSRKGTNFLTRALADPLSLAASLVRGRVGTEFSSAKHRRALARPRTTISRCSGAGSICRSAG